MTELRKRIDEDTLVITTQVESTTIKKKSEALANIAAICSDCAFGHTCM